MKLTFINFLGPMLSDIFIANGRHPAELGWAGRPELKTHVVLALPDLGACQVETF